MKVPDLKEKRELKKTFNEIKKLKIQGAQAVAEAALDAVYRICKKNKGIEKKELKKVIKYMFHSRETEPEMRNGLIMFYYSLNEGLDSAYKKVREHFKVSKEKIIEIGSRKLKELAEVNGKRIVVYTHCHSSTALGIIINAKKQGVPLRVVNTETRPLFQGRITAKELARRGIKVKHFVDSAMRLAIKEADICLIGCDAISTEGRVYNKIGSQLVAETAKNYNVPLYICTNSWKYDPMTFFGFEEEIEKRHSKEVWKIKNKNIEISNRAFEIVNPDLVSGVICELGILPVRNIHYSIKKKYPLLFKGLN